MQKKISDSKAEHVQILMPEHINANKRLFGGRLMEWIDVVAAVVARRHSGCEVTTAAIDNLQFLAPAYKNDTVILVGRMTYVGCTSMEVRVDTFTENLQGERKLINTAYLVMVALGEDEKPKCVPELVLETEEEKKEFEAGKRRHELRSLRRKQGY